MCYNLVHHGKACIYCFLPVLLQKLRKLNLLNYTLHFKSYGKS